MDAPAMVFLSLIFIGVLVMVIEVAYKIGVKAGRLAEEDEDELPYHDSSRNHYDGI